MTAETDRALAEAREMVAAEHQAGMPANVVRVALLALSLNERATKLEKRRFPILDGPAIPWSNADAG